MVTDVQKKILHNLRINARSGFSLIGRAHNIPVTTVFDNYERLVESGLVKKHICVLDFQKLGFFQRVMFILKSKDRESLLDFLNSQACVNSILRVSDADFSVDCVFPTIKEFYDFKETLEMMSLDKVEHHEIYDHVKIEDFRV